MARGCGDRVKGGVYVEVALSPHGLPIEAFLIDPPSLVLDPTALGVSPIGTTLVDSGERAMLFDWIGAQHYPNVADFVEEAKALGVSRRISSAADFERITIDTQLVCLHSRAIINVADELRAVIGGPIRCPKDQLVQAVSFKDALTRSAFGEVGDYADHVNGPGMCAGLWWHDIEGGEPDHSKDHEAERVVRRTPSVVYDGWQHGRLVDEGHRPRYALGAFAMFKIGRIAVVHDPVGGKHEKALEKASRAGVEVTEVEA